MRKINPLSFCTITVITALVCSSSAFAKNTNISQQQLRRLVDRIVTQRTQKLQHRVDSLERQVNQLKAKHRLKRKHRSIKHNKRSTSYRTSHKVYTPVTRMTAKSHKARKASTARMLADSHLLGTSVITSPYFGVHSAYDGSDLIVNASSINLDTRLLEQKLAMNEALTKRGLKFPKYPVVELSGELAGEGIVTKTKPGNTTSDLNLSSAELDVFSEVGPWISAYMNFSYDDTVMSSPTRTTNSNIMLDKGFITIGNLNRSHLYASLGQLFVPFGRYSGYMISSPLTKSVGRVKARALVLGSYHALDNGLFGAAYIFGGDTSGNRRVAGGFNLGYRGSYEKFSSKIDVGVISNIAESYGMQTTDAPSVVGFTGFGSTAKTEKLQHGVPGIDVNGELTYGDYSLLAEYVGATRAFDLMDMSFNGHRAKPQAVHVEGVYNLNCYGKPGNFAIGYDWTKDALALWLPHQRYLASFGISLLRNTVETLEFRHDVNYKMKDRASGAGSKVFGPSNKSENVLTAKIYVSF